MLYLFNLDLSILYCFSIPILPDYKLRDSKGRPRPTNQEEIKAIIPSATAVIDPLIGNLLGDGSLRFTHKDLNGKPKLSTNALYTITLKNKYYIYHFWQNIYNSICTNTEPRLGRSPSLILKLESQFLNMHLVQKAYLI